MGKPRVRGSHAKIFVQDQAGNNIEVGEINKFSVKELGELKKSRAIGEHTVTSTKTFEGYDLSFEGGKVDWKLAALLHQQDDAITQNKRTPYFKVIQTITYYQQGSETFTYPEVTIHGYNMDIDANDEITEKFEGFCGQLRVRTPSSSNDFGTTPGIDAIITATIAKDSYPTS